MYSTTPFQFLPPHIVQLIVKHVVGSARTCCSEEAQIFKMRERLLIPLLSVCHNFRGIVLSRFHRDCYLSLRDGYDRVGKAHITWPSSPQKPSSAIHHLVKTLEIRIDDWVVYSGEALEMLLAPPFDGVSFPLANRLSVHLHYSYKHRDSDDSDDSEESDISFPPNAVNNIKEFVQRIEDMAPAIGEVVVDTYDEFTNWIRNNEYYYADLFGRLFRIAKTITAFKYPYGVMERYVNMDQMRDLVRLTCCIYEQGGQVVALARRSTQTLQYLDIRSYSFAGIIGLIQDPISGEYVEYPRLQILKLSHTKEQRSPRSTCNGAIPFPRLRRLYLQDDYPFVDDVAFRGNSATLEYLSLELRQETADILRKHSVFTTTSHSRLQCVNITKLPIGARSEYVAVDTYLQYVMSIAPGASVRQSASVQVSDEEIPPALSVIGNNASIQVLSLPDMTLTLWEAISLINSLPFLSDLTSGTPKLGKRPQGTSATNLPKHVFANYAPMGERFQCWRVTKHRTHDVEEIATVILLLALACPTFNYAFVDGLYTNMEINKAMKRVLAERGYRKHSRRLRRLLSN